MIWSQLKKRVGALLVHELQGRFELRSANYRGAHDDAGRGYITLDGAEIWESTFKISPAKALLGNALGRLYRGTSNGTLPLTERRSLTSVRTRMKPGTS